MCAKRVGHSRSILYPRAEITESSGSVITLALRCAGVLVAGGRCFRFLTAVLGTAEIAPLRIFSFLPFLVIFDIFLPRPTTEVWKTAEEGTRTPTAFRPPAPKAGASANSATSAYGRVYHRLALGLRLPTPQRFASLRAQVGFPRGETWHFARSAGRRLRTARLLPGLRRGAGGARRSSERPARRACQPHRKWMKKLLDCSATFLAGLPALSSTSSTSDPSCASTRRSPSSCSAGLTYLYFVIGAVFGFSFLPGGWAGFSMAYVLYPARGPARLHSVDAADD